ncbi:MAG: iron-containing alcohol dehydrogenase [Lachnospiraceae bacterium]|nr:iron-containing alcohol dehydrogenase [Lachnospiraceae bacterium]
MEFVFETPAGSVEHVYEGYDCVRDNAEVLCSCGKHALIVTGRHSAAANGSLRDVITALENGGVSYSHFSEIEENPSVETIMKARDYGFSEGADFVIGIGGGSPMDAAKAIAVMIANADRGSGYLYDRSVADVKALPVVAVPTTCGTGSEMTGVAVLTRHDKGTKESMVYKVFPRFAFIDPKYLKAAPDSVICNTAMDAFGHMAESYMCKNRNDKSMAAVETGLNIWSMVKDKLMGGDDLDDDDLEKLMLSSMYAGIAISYTGTSIPHGLSYRVTYKLGVPHGRAIGYFQYGFLREAPEEESKKVLEFAGFDTVEDVDDYFKKTCGFKPLDAEVLGEAVDELMQVERKLKGAVFNIDRDVLLRICETCR